MKIDSRLPEWLQATQEPMLSWHVRVHNSVEIFPIRVSADDQCRIPEQCARSEGASVS